MRKGFFGRVVNVAGPGPRIGRCTWRWRSAWSSAGSAVIAIPPARRVSVERPVPKSSATSCPVRPLVRARRGASSGNARAGRLPGENERRPVTWLALSTFPGQVPVLNYLAPSPATRGQRRCRFLLLRRAAFPEGCVLSPDEASLVRGGGEPAPRTDPVRAGPEPRPPLRTSPLNQRRGQFGGHSRGRRRCTRRPAHAAPHWTG